MARIQRQPQPTSVDLVEEHFAQSAPAADIGHNNPPPADMARDEFDARLDALLDEQGIDRSRIDAVVASAGRALCEDDEQAGRCGDLIRQIRSLSGLVNQAHSEVKAPYLAAGRAVDDKKNTLNAPLDAAKRSVDNLLSAHMQRKEAAAREEQRRREQEERDRRAEQERIAREQEAERRRLAEENRYQRAVGELVGDPLPEPEPMPAPEPEPEVVHQAASIAVRSDMGVSVSGKKNWTYEITDYDSALLSMANNATVKEAVEKAVSAQVRAGVREIAGVRIFQSIKANVR